MLHQILELMFMLTNTNPAYGAVIRSTAKARRSRVCSDGWFYCV